MQFSTRVGPPLRLDVVNALYGLLRELRRGDIPPAEGSRRLADVYQLRPTFGWSVRLLGHAVLTVGLVLLLQPTLPGVGAACLLGLLVGLLKLPRLATDSLILPVGASFVTATIVFEASRFVVAYNPIRLLVAPLVTFLPGGMLAIATMELAEGQMVSGASRLVNGFVQLALLAFGILAAAALVHVPPSELLDRPLGQLGGWTSMLGVLLFALGIFFTSPPRSAPFLGPWWCWSWPTPAKPSRT